MSWSAVLIALLVSHLVGDFLLQTEWQALDKSGGLRDSVGRRALGRHALSYTAAFGPALVWIGAQTNALRAVAVGALVAIPHVLVDDGWLVRAWLRDVKRAADPAPALSIVGDQSFHVVCLLGAGLVAAT